MPKVNSTSAADNCESREYELIDSEMGCRDPTNLNEIPSSSLKSCQRWIYDRSVFSSTLITKFDLVCDRDWMKSLVGMMYMIGLFLGSLVVGFAADRYGRKPTLMISMMGLSLSGIFAGFRCDIISD